MIFAPETRVDLGPLVRPVYVPSFVYAAGSSALLPAQVLLALQVGFTSAGVAALMTWIGLFAIASSLIAGHFVDWIGERIALAVVTIGGAIGLVAAAGCCTAGLPGRRWVLVVALTVFDLVDAVWSIARQGLVADLAPATMRGRAMNLYGACQRLGRIVGPLIAAAVLTVSGAAAVFPCAALVVIAALALLLGANSKTVPSGRHGALTTGATTEKSSKASGGMRVGAAPWWIRHQFLVLGVGALILSALRTVKETLLPLWTVQGAHLDGTQVALVLALASGAELILFWPAGLASDRYGRAPVIVTAMAFMSAGICLAPWSETVAWLLPCVTLIGLGDGAGAGIIKTLGADLAPETGRAAFLGRWQAIASVGSLLAPAVTGFALATTSLPAALLLNGMVGLVGTVWMAWWTPKILPGVRLPARVPPP